MKRLHVPSEYLFIAALVLAFLTLASPAAAAQSCLGLGEYYNAARQCSVEREVIAGSLPMLLSYAVLAGATVGLMSLRHYVLRMARR